MAQETIFPMNPKTMVTYVARSNDRIFHPRFLVLSRQHAAHAPAGQRMNQSVMEPSPLSSDQWRNNDGPARPRQAGRKVKLRTRCGFCAASCSRPNWFLMIWNA